MAFLKDLLAKKGKTKVMKYSRAGEGISAAAFDSPSGDLSNPKYPVAGADNLYNQGAALYIEHVPTGYFVEFPAMIETLSDAYMTNWSQEKVYGRMDPIATYADTTRAISLAWKVISSNVEEARTNLEKINGLLSFLYPLYKEQGGNGGAILNMGPLIKVKFGNLVQNAQTGGALLGFINGITFDPDIIEGGMWTYYGDGPMGTGGVEYIPKVVALNFEMNVLHEHKMGWRNEGDGEYVWRSEPVGGGGTGFPFGTGGDGTSTNTDNIANSWSTSVQKGFDPNTPAAGVNGTVTD